MSVLNVNMPERDLDPEEIDLEQEEEDAFGMSPPHQPLVAMAAQI